jgi:hypothetical protein
MPTLASQYKSRSVIQRIYINLKLPYLEKLTNEQLYYNNELYKQ